MSQIALPLPMLPDRRRMPVEPIARAAEVEGPYRWTLTRKWGPGPLILICGLNPSTANGDRDDPTMLREIGFAYRWGFGALIKVSVYPFVASNPADMWAWRAGLKKPAWDFVGAPLLENVWAIRRAIFDNDIATFWAAWGACADAYPDGDLTEFLARATRPVDSEVEGMCDIEIDWKCVGTNADGSPRHTLARGRNRVLDSATLVPWRRTV